MRSYLCHQQRCFKAQKRGRRAATGGYGSLDGRLPEDASHIQVHFLGNLNDLRNHEL